MKPELSVLLVSYRTPGPLGRCLASLGPGLEGLRWEAVVVDNAPGDGSAEAVRRSLPSAKLLANEENRGYAAGVNQAAAAAEGRWLLLLNPDARLRPGAGRALAAFLGGRPRAAAVGPLLLDPAGRPVPSAYPELGPLAEAARLARVHRWLPEGLRPGPPARPRAPVKVARVTGACLLLRREAWEEVGPFDEAFFVYGATHDWCLRARSRGWEVWLDPRASAEHEGGAATREEWGDLESHRRKLEAHDRLLRRHAGAARAWLAWLLRGLSARLALAAAPFTGAPEPLRARLRLERDWIGRRLMGGEE